MSTFMESFRILDHLQIVSELVLFITHEGEKNPFKIISAVQC